MGKKVAEKVGTRIYGASDDLIEFEGEFSGEVGCYAESDSELGVLVIVSDGTLLDVRYGKNGAGIFAIACIKKGTLFKRIDQCADEDADPHSDVAHFGAGVRWAFAAKDWERVSQSGEIDSGCPG